MCVGVGGGTNAVSLVLHNQTDRRAGHVHTHTLTCFLCRAGGGQVTLRSVALAVQQQEAAQTASTSTVKEARIVAHASQRHDWWRAALVCVCVCANDHSVFGKQSSF